MRGVFVLSIIMVGVVVRVDRVVTGYRLLVTRDSRALRWDGSVVNASWYRFFVRRLQQRCIDVVVLTRHRKEFWWAICSLFSLGSRQHLPLGAGVGGSSGDRGCKPPVGALLGVGQACSATFRPGELNFDAGSSRRRMLRVCCLSPPMVFGLGTLWAVLRPSKTSSGGIKVALA